MRKRFVFAAEDEPGEAWRARFAAGREEAERWYLGAAEAALGGATAAPSPKECRDAYTHDYGELAR